MAALTDLALDLLQLALVAGDVRAALFFATEIRAGRDPSRTLAEAVEAAMQRHGLARRDEAPSAPIDETIDAEREVARPLSRAERCLLPDPPAKADTARRRDEADFPYCVATLPTAEAAVALMAEQAGNLDADLFLNRRRIERPLLDQGKQQRDCTGFGIHSEVTEEFSGFRAAFHRRVLGAFILRKLTSDQQPGPCQAAQSGTADRRLDHSEAIF